MGRCLQHQPGVSWTPLCSLTLVTVTNYHKLTGLQQYRYSSGDRKSEVSLTGVKSRCGNKNCVPLETLRGESLSLCFSAYKGCLNSL